MNALLILLALAAEVIPPVPAQHFNDYAHVASPAAAADLNRQLEDFERATSSQIIVAVFPKMQTDSSIEDYTVRVAQSWKIGQKGKDNGAVLFVFVQDRKMYLQVGYGLEGALPDALAKRIIENEIKPRFRARDFDGGLRAGVRAILQATRGEYTGTGRRAADEKTHSFVDQIPPALIDFLLGLGILLLLFRLPLLFAAGMVYGSSGRRKRRGSWNDWLPSGGGFSSGGGGGGGFSVGGGFSGGGGGFGGGGAGGSW